MLAVLLLEGEPAVAPFVDQSAGNGDAMTGDNLGKDGKRVWYRVSWKQQTSGRAGVRETAVTSKNGGKSWQPAFEILFVKDGTAATRMPAVR